MRAIPVDVINCQTMNILIEDAEKLEYLTSNSQWTKKPAEGKSFAATENAFAAAKKELVGKFNIVGYVTETQQFINLNHGKGRTPETVAA